MRPRQHRRVGVRVRQRAQACRDVAQRRQQHVLARRGQRQRVREIVDVLGRAREVNELGDPRHFGHRREALLQPVLDGLDVVIGLALDLLDARRIGRRERLRRCVERRRAAAENGGTSAIAGSSASAMSHADFDAHAMADQPEFAEMAGQRGDLAGIAAVERGQRGQGAKCAGRGASAVTMRRSGARQSDAIARGRRSQCSTQRACARALRHVRRRTGCVGTRCYNFPPALPKKRLPVLKLIASKTSPYVRKVRIALAEKKIEYQMLEVSPGIRAIRCTSGVRWARCRCWCSTTAPACSTRA